MGEAWRYLKELRLDRGPLSHDEAVDELRGALTDFPAEARDWLSGPEKAPPRALPGVRRALTTSLGKKT